AIIPIETNVSEYMGSFGFPRSTLFRDKTFARQIHVTLKKFNGLKLYVLLGGFHSLALQKELKRFGIKAKINFGLLGAKKAGDFSSAFRESGKLSRREGFEKAKKRFLLGLRERDMKQKARIQGNLIERKRRIGKRLIP
ncbi:hypothetical protein HZB89_00205, partial [archaeon]|nr:hypothetical protein [archaeon]